MDDLTQAMSDSLNQWILNNTSTKDIEEEDEFRKNAMPEQIHFFDTDPKTQELLVAYSDFVNKGEGDIIEFIKIASTIYRDKPLRLYIYVKTDDMWEKQLLEGNQRSLERK